MSKIGRYLNNKEVGIGVGALLGKSQRKKIATKYAVFGVVPGVVIGVLTGVAFNSYKKV